MMIASEQFDAPPAICEQMAQEAEARSQAPPQREPGDPWEGANRFLYGVNDVLDRVAIRPIAMTYRRILPRPVRGGVRNMLSNLEEPGLVVDNLLQGHVGHAGGATMRFATNSTLGVLGIVDVAQHIGWKRHDTDFGITLGRMRVPAGPYLYVPILGPSSVRDLAGTGVDFALDPLNWIPFRGSTTFNNTTTAMKGIESRVAIEEELAAMKRGAVDPYATVRSIYTQLRESEVRGGGVDIGALPDFPDEPPIADTPADQPPPDPAPNRPQ